MLKMYLLSQIQFQETPLTAPPRKTRKNGMFFLLRILKMHCYSKIKLETTYLTVQDRKVVK